jgi:hypothetical protein
MLLIHELVHATVGALLAASLWRWLGARFVMWVLLTSLLMDADHLLDYVLTMGATVDLSAVASGRYFEQSGRVVVALHSWELALSLLVLGLVPRVRAHRAALFGIGVGMLGHMAVDQVWYGAPVGHFFLVLRAMHGFAPADAW